MTVVIMALAAGEIEEDILAQWLRDQIAAPHRTR